MTINLCFHGIGVSQKEREPGEAKYWVSEDVFLGILDAVVDAQAVSLSFDDGNRSDVDIALPALSGRNLSATFFALAGRLHDPSSLSAGDLRVLRSEGMSIGNHGWAHIPWRSLSQADRLRELVDARSALAEASDGAIPDAALPLGQYDRRLLAQLRSAGYSTVFTSDRFHARAGSWMQARYSVTAADTVESVGALIAQKFSPSEARNITASFAKRLR